MSNYSAGNQKMDKWRSFAAEALERFPPSFLMVLFLLALYRAIDATDQTPVINWIQSRIGFSAETWKTTFLLTAGAIAYFKPEPKITLLLTIPAAFFGGFVMWYGLATEMPSTAITFVLFCWLALGMANVVMVLYQEQLVANEILANEISSHRKEQASADTTDAAH